MKEGMTIKTRYREELQKKYRLIEISCDRGIETTSYSKNSESQKIKERIKQFRQNKLFQTDQSRLYQELNGEDRSGVSPDKEEAKSFWSNIII